MSKWNPFLCYYSKSLINAQIRAKNIQKPPNGETGKCWTVYCQLDSQRLRWLVTWTISDSMQRAALGSGRMNGKIFIRMPVFKCPCPILQFPSLKIPWIGNARVYRAQKIWKRACQKCPCPKNVCPFPSSLVCTHTISLMIFREKE